MEEGVINEILKSGIYIRCNKLYIYEWFQDLGELFDEKQFIKDVSGAGNNW